MNPVRAGIVVKPQDYIYSSASNYVDDKGLVAITLATNPIVNTQKVTNITNYIRYD